MNVNIGISDSDTITVKEGTGVTSRNLTIQRITPIINIGMIGIKGEKGDDGAGGTIATGAELDIGTDNTKAASAKALKDSHNVPSVAPSTLGNVLTSNGTDWISSAPVAGAGDMLLGTEQTITAAKTFNSGTLKVGENVAVTSTSSELNLLSGKNSVMEYFAIHANGYSLVASDYSGMRTQLGLDDSITNLIISANGKSLVASDYAGMKTQLGLGSAAYTASTCYAQAPATNSADYVPQWNGTPNSKTLIDGFPISANGKTLVSTTYDNMKTLLDIASGGHTIQEEGSSLTQRTKLNFIGVSVTVTDNSGDDSTDVTITGGASYITTFENADLTAGVLTVSHNFGNQYCNAPVIIDNNGLVVIPDEITYTSTTAMAVDISSQGTITGTWRVVVLDSGATYNFSLASPGAIGETTPSTIRGKNKEIFKTETGSLSVAECSGTIISCLGLTNAACNLTLPTAEEGLSFVWILPTERAQIVRLRAAASDQIYLSGVHGSDNGYVGYASGWVHGSSLSMFTFKNTDNGYDWFCMPIFGTVVAS